MSKTRKLTVLLLLGTMALAAGCGSKKAKEAKKTAVNFYKSLEEGSKELFMASVNAEEDQEDFAERFFDAMSAMCNFWKKLEKEYGKEEVLKLRRGTSAAPFTAESIEKQAEVNVEDDEATTKMPDGRTLYPVVYKDGRWLVEIGVNTLSAGAREETMKGFVRMKEAANRAEAKIGQEGQTAEKIIRQMEAEIMGTAPQQE